VASPFTSALQTFVVEKIGVLTEREHRAETTRQQRVRIDQTEARRRRAERAAGRRGFVVDCSERFPLGCLIASRVVTIKFSCLTEFHQRRRTQKKEERARRDQRGKKKEAALSSANVRGSTDPSPVMADVGTTEIHLRKSGFL